MIHICKGLTPTDTEIYKTLISMQPKKWAIERNPSNHIEVNKWANEHDLENTYQCFSNYLHSEIVDKNYAWPYLLRCIKEGFTEITIEQFREITNPTKSNTMNIQPRFQRYHQLKTWPIFFNRMGDGQKTYELRKNDRDFQVGDIIILMEWAPESSEYTGEELRYEITHVLTQTEFGLQPGYCILSLTTTTN